MCHEGCCAAQKAAAAARVRVRGAERTGRTELNPLTPPYRPTAGSSAEELGYRIAGQSLRAGWRCGPGGWIPRGLPPPEVIGGSGTAALGRSSPGLLDNSPIRRLSAVG